MRRETPVHFKQEEDRDFLVDENGSRLRLPGDGSGGVTMSTNEAAGTFTLTVPEPTP